MTSLRQKHVSPQIRQTIVQYLIDNSELQTVSTFEAIHAVKSASRIASCPIVSLATLLRKVRSMSDLM
jgi:hypothetical protein